MKLKKHKMISINRLYFWRRFPLILSVIIHFQFIIAQNNITITGTVTDSKTGEPLVGANLIIKNTFTGTKTDKSGKFILEVSSAQANNVLLVSYLGYTTKEIDVSKVQIEPNIPLELNYIMGKEVVITASRISETILQSPSQVQKLNSKDIREIPSFDYLDGLNELMGVDVSTNSFGFKATNVRGFNAGFNSRSPVLIDGIDNQSPGLNFPLGNLFGPQETDLDNIEVISGPASALYGPNAFLGVISMKTKNPFEYPGFQVKIQGGGQNLKAGEIRYAENFSNSNSSLLRNRLGIKITCAYLKADEYTTDNNIKYGKITSQQDIDAIVNQLQFSPDSATAAQFKGINQYLTFFPQARPGKQFITSPGYSETELTDNTSRNLKMGGALYYKIKPSLTASYDYHFMKGDALFSTFTRIRLKNATFNQHKVELTGKNFFVRGYAVLENAGDTYGLDFTGSYLSAPYFYNYINNYINAYFNSLAQQTNNFNLPPTASAISMSQNNGVNYGNLVWLSSGTKAFDSLSNIINSNPHLNEGAKFQDKSSMIHCEGQYNFSFNFGDVIAGASYRKYFPRSYGTVFTDTLTNKKDTLFNGEPNPNAPHADVSSYEAGAYLQVVKKMSNDKLKFTGSIRLDKSKNYDIQLSPRISAIYTLNNQTFRLSAQTAFRSPDQFDQYALIDFGFITRSGNLHGFNNAYTQESVTAFQYKYLSTGMADVSLLKTIILNPVKPEHVKAIELGYRDNLEGKLYLDASASISSYDDFIGLRNIIIPKGSAQAGDISGLNAVTTGNINVYSVPSNASQQTTIYQAAIGIQYYYNDNFTFLTNYSYSIQKNINNITDPLVPPYNTAPHEIGLGLRGRSIFKNAGLYIFAKWIDSYKYAAGAMPYSLHSRRITNVQLNYECRQFRTILKIGVTNILNEKYEFDSPRVGRVIFAGINFDFH